MTVLGCRDQRRATLFGRLRVAAVGVGPGREQGAHVLLAALGRRANEARPERLRVDRPGGLRREPEPVDRGAVSHALGDLQRRLSPVVRRLGVGPGTEQCLDQFDLPPVRRDHQWRGPLGQLGEDLVIRLQGGVRVGTGFEEDLQQPRPAEEGGFEERRAPVSRGGIDVGPAIQEQADDPHLGPADGQVQWRIAVVGGGIGVGSEVEQAASQFLPSLSGRPVQGGRPLGRASVDVGAGREQPLDDRRASLMHGDHQRRHRAVTVPFDVRPGFQKRIDDRHASRLGRVIQGHLVPIVGRIRIGPGSEGGLHLRDAPPRHGPEQWRVRHDSSPPYPSYSDTPASLAVRVSAP